MKGKKNSLKLILTGLLSLSVLIQFNVLPEVVLCIGEDGHIEIELAIGDQCGSIPLKTPDENLNLFNSEDDHCGQCSDIPLITAASNISNDKTSTSVSQASDWIEQTALDSPVFNFPLRQVFPTHPGSEFSQTLKTLRTVRIIV